MQIQEINMKPSAKERTLSQNPSPKFASSTKIQSPNDLIGSERVRGLRIRRGVGARPPLDAVLPSSSKSRDPNPWLPTTPLDSEEREREVKLERESVLLLLSATATSTRETEERERGRF